MINTHKWINLGERHIEKKHHHQGNIVNIGILHQPFQHEFDLKRLYYIQNDVNTLE